jgi:hypothetical protein
MNAWELRDYMVKRGIVARPCWKRVAIGGWLFVGVLIVLIVGTADYKVALEVENERLHTENARLRGPHGTCRVDPGERVMATHLNGTVSCWRMTKREIVVTAPQGGFPPIKSESRKLKGKT